MGISGVHPQPRSDPGFSKAQHYWRELGMSWAEGTRRSGGPRVAVSQGIASVLHGTWLGVYTQVIHPWFQLFYCIGVI